MSSSPSNRGLIALLAASLYLGFLARGPAGVAPQGAVLDEDSGFVDSGVIDGSGPAVQGSQAEGRGPDSTGPIRRTQGKLSCAAGRNGGETDVGVSGNRIRLATTAVLDGPAKSLLSDSPLAMQAVINKVNRAGGICGRLLELKVVNDSFQSDLGQRFIQNFIAEEYFSLPVVPSAEGLSAAIDSGSISKAGIPVVGADGMRIEQYGDPWVWPVATATVSTMRIMAEYGHRVKDARSFAIVYDSKYKFGLEGANAFVDYVEKKLGREVVAKVPLDPEQASYGSEVNEFNSRCSEGGKSKCDMVAFLLLPDAAVKWFSKRPIMGAKYTSAAQTLFTESFAKNCFRVAGFLCSGVAAWTGYVPPIDRLRGLPDVEEYINDVTSARPGIDVTNQFVQGSYIGMSVFVEALEKVGPDLTRKGLREVLDSMKYKSDLAPDLTWRPGNHGANIRARAFSIVGSSTGFEGWRDERTGWVVDPQGGPR